MDHHVEHRQKAEELAAVAEPGHAIEFAALLVVLYPLVVARVGNQDGPRRRPLQEVGTGGHRDQPAPEVIRVPAAVEGEVLAAFGMARHGDRLQDLVVHGEHRVDRVLAPVDPVGGVGHPVAALRLAPLPRHHPVAFLLRRRRIDDHRGAVLVEHDDVVVGGAIERVAPEVGLVPVDPAVGGGVEHQVALRFPYLRRAVLVAAADAAQVPHHEAAGLGVAVHRAIDVDPASLPRPVGHQDRLWQLPPGVQRAHQAAHGGDHDVIHEELRDAAGNGRGVIHGSAKLTQRLKPRKLQLPPFGERARSPALGETRAARGVCRRPGTHAEVRSARTSVEALVCNPAAP